MSLLDKASILVTPTAYDVGSINAIKPKDSPYADLTFDRGTSATATRIGGNGNIKDVSQDVPRLDFRGANHWLFEPQATNLATYSEGFAQGKIFYNSGSPVYTNISLSTATIDSPDGTTSATKLTSSSVGGTGEVNISYFNVDLDATNNSTLSLFAKKGTKDIIAFRFQGYDTMNDRIYYDLTNGTVGTGASSFLSSSIEDYGNGWYRCSVTLEEQPIDRRGSVRFHVCNTDGSLLCDRDGLSDLFIWGLQTEISTLTHPTSYIPTSGSTVTRDGETALGGGDSTMFNDTEGVFYVELASFTESGSDRFLSISDGTNSEAVRLKLSSSSNRIDAVIRDENTTVVGVNYTVSDITEFNKVAIKYKSGDTALWVGGVERATSTVTFALNGLDELALNQSQGGNPFYGKIKCIAVFKEALTDTELQCLTS